MFKTNKMNYIFLILPFLDLITALFTRNFSLPITPGILVKGVFIIYLIIFISCSQSKYKKVSLIFLGGYIFYMLFYFLTKTELLNFDFIFNELIYIFKLLYFPLVFLGLLCYYDEFKFDAKSILKLIAVTLIIYTVLLLIPFLIGNAYNTYPDILDGKIGWFFSGNEISNIVVLLLASLFYFIEHQKKYLFLVFIPIIFIIFEIGTKVSFLGTIIVILITFIFGNLYSIKCNRNMFSKYLFILCITIFCSFFSVTRQNYKYLSENEFAETIVQPPIIIDDINKEEIENIQNQINLFFDKNKMNSIISKLLSGRNIYVANTLSIYNNDLTNNNILFGIGFSNTEKVDNYNIAKLIEIDILDGFFHYGIIGLLIMLSPFLIGIFLIIKSKEKITLLSIYYSLILLLVIGISSFSGHTFTAPAVSFYVVIYILLLLNEYKIFGRTKKLNKKISILSLHLGYGGIEKCVVNQANMLCDNYDVEIISLYRLYDYIPYAVDERVNIRYLTDLKPNREEFLKYFHDKNILKIIIEGLKSIKILYLKKKLIGNYIYNSDSKIIISTRLEFTELLNKYYNVNCIRIAEEHVYHNNSIKYINKLKKALKNIDYLIPASKYLTNDYKKYFQNEKINILYIPQTIGDIPKLFNKCNNYNIIAVGRLVKEKGFTDLIEVMDIIVKKNNKIKLTIVGDGYQKEIIDKLIKDKKLSHNITLKGYLNSNELVKEYKKASLFVMTSLEESFGLVLIEAMSYGIPCIAFDSALGAKEIINGKSGILIKKRNKEKMAKEILNYFESNPNNEMSKEAKMHSEAYSNKQVKTIWDKFIINLLKY